MKRLLDITLAAGVLLLFLPLGLIIALILKFTGEGYIFYLQERVGRGLNPFMTFKFSTMLKDSPNLGTGMITLRNDPRVFPFGRVLRMTKINEIPQLLNVLKGDMSLVGPRPMVRSDISFLPEEVQRRVYSVRPGLTGLGSVVFRDEEKIISATKKDLRRRYCEDIAPLKADLELWYVNHRSIGLDLRIMFLTGWLILFPHSRAYGRLLRADWPKFEARIEALNQRVDLSDEVLPGKPGRGLASSAPSVGP